MIKYIIGDIKYIGEDFIILDNNGIGYKIGTSTSILRNFDINKNYQVHTYMAIREDAMDLYGFFDREELDFFELLISVSTIGPKNALSILSTLDAASIQKAINNNDIEALTKAKGVGKKTASRIILELSDKVSKMPQLEEAEEVHISSDLDAAVDALANLGYQRSDVVKGMTKVETENREIEDIIKDCLLILSSR